MYNWTFLSDAGGAHMYFCNRGWSYTCDWDPPQGRWALAMKLDSNKIDGTMYSAVNVPARGNYDLSFMTCARTGQYLPFHISLVNEASGITNWASGGVCYRNDGYSIRRYRTPVLDAQ